MNKPYAERTHEKMKEVLMRPDAQGPDIHYYMVRGGPEKKNITIWESGKVDGEYIKTYGHYHILDFKETYTVLSGEGIILLQIRKKNEDGTWASDTIESFKALKIKAGDSISIPSFAGHLVVNTGPTWLVTSDDSPFTLEESASAPSHADYEAVKLMHGFAYYVVEKNGEPVLVKNERYAAVPEASIEEFDGNAL
jgi:glucose-6-phosphate isomerase